MTSVMPKYTDLYPKRADITGSHEQAFGLNTKVTQTIINAIKANTVAAIGTVATGSVFSSIAYLSLGVAIKGATSFSWYMKTKH